MKYKLEYQSHHKTVLAGNYSSIDAVRRAIWNYTASHIGDKTGIARVELLQHGEKRASYASTVHCGIMTF